MFTSRELSRNLSESKLRRGKPRQLSQTIVNEIDKFIDSNLLELTLHNVNSSRDRYEIYEIAKENNLFAESFVYEGTTNKYIIIKKGIIKTEEYNHDKITIDFVNFFVRYTEIPVPTNHPDHFEYFINALDKYFDSRRYLDLIYDDIKLFNKDGKLDRKYFALYKKHIWKIKETIQSTIKHNPEYKAFCEMSVDSFPQITTNENNLYSDENVGKTLISIDVKSANYRVLKKFCPSIFGSANSWSEFVQGFTEYKFLLESKPFRMILINELDNKNGHKFPIIFVNDVYEVIKSSHFNDTLNLVCCKNDEIVFEVKHPDTFNYEEFSNLVNSVHDFFRIEVFKLRHVSNKKYYIKEFIDNSADSTNLVNPTKKIEFKNIPKRHIMQVIRHYENSPLEELDTKYVEETGIIYDSDIIFE